MKVLVMSVSHKIMRREYKYEENIKILFFLLISVLIKVGSYKQNT